MGKDDMVDGQRCCRCRCRLPSCSCPLLLLFFFVQKGAAPHTHHAESVHLPRPAFPPLLCSAGRRRVCGRPAARPRQAGRGDRVRALAMRPGTGTPRHPPAPSCLVHAAVRIWSCLLAQPQKQVEFALANAHMCSNPLPHPLPQLLLGQLRGGARPVPPLGRRLCGRQRAPGRSQLGAAGAPLPPSAAAARLAPGLRPRLLTRRWRLHGAWLEALNPRPRTAC